MIGMALVSVVSILAGFVVSPAVASSYCPFKYETRLVESSAGQALILGADGRPLTAAGNWAPIYSRPENDRVRRFGQSIGRLDICWENAEGKLVITHCTAALLKDNLVLTNHHCFDATASSKLDGFFLAEARLVMGYDDVEDVSGVKSYSVPVNAAASSEIADALLMRVRGNPVGEWGHLKLVSESGVEPEQ